MTNTSYIVLYECNNIMTDMMQKSILVPIDPFHTVISVVLIFYHSIENVCCSV